MLCSVQYIHSKGIIHCNLKLENFLFSNRGAYSELKMIDFSLSKHFKFDEVQSEAVGTPYTVAPDVIPGSYNERCDVWAIGELEKVYYQWPLLSCTIFSGEKWWLTLVLLHFQVSSPTCF